MPFMFKQPPYIDTNDDDEEDGDVSGIPYRRFEILLCCVVETQKFTKPIFHLKPYPITYTVLFKNINS